MRRLGCFPQIYLSPSKFGESGNRFICVCYCKIGRFRVIVISFHCVLCTRPSLSQNSESRDDSTKLVRLLIEILGGS